MSRTKNLVEALCEFHNYDFRKYKGNQRIDKIARNLVDYVAGQTIFEAARGIIPRHVNIKPPLPVRWLLTLLTIGDALQLLSHSSFVVFAHTPTIH